MYAHNLRLGALTDLDDDDVQSCRHDVAVVVLAVPRKGVGSVGQQPFMGNQLHPPATV